MKNILAAFGLMIIMGAVLTSCLKDDNEDAVTYFDDTAITAFSIGTLTRTLHTTSSTGEDSTYTGSVTGSLYDFTIDQQRGLIYNTDSLPVGTSVERVLCTITTKNAGIAALNLRTSDGLRDSLVAYSSTDSIDLSKPLEVRVYSNSGIAYRKYTLTVNVHQEDGDVFNWTQMATNSQASFAAATKVRMASVGGRPYWFGLSGTGEHTMMYDLLDCIENAGSDESSYTEYGAAAIDNVVSRDGEMLVLDGQRLWHTTVAADGTWKRWYDDNRLTDGISRLVGASAKEIYALGENGELLVSTDNCETWAEESLDSDADLLPEQNISCTVHPLRTNSNMTRVMLVGTRQDKEYAVVWMKIVDEQAPGAGRWMLIADGTDHDKAYALPSELGLSVMAYDGQDMAIGMTDNGTLGDICLSSDGGITWKANSTLAWPEGVACTGTLAATADSNNTIWVVMGGSGQVWRGRLNRLGWETK